MLLGLKNMRKEAPLRASCFSYGSPHISLFNSSSFWLIRADGRKYEPEEEQNKSGKITQPNSGLLAHRDKAHSTAFLETEQSEQANYDVNTIWGYED